MRARPARRILPRADAVSRIAPLPSTPAARPSHRAMLQVPPSPAAPSRAYVESRVRFYDVQGSSAAELSRGMDLHGPRWNGRPWAAYTDAPVTWSYSFAPAADGCAITRAQVRLRVMTTLPRWNPPSGAPPALVREWNAFADALRRHEDGHAEIARRSAGELQDTLAGLRTPTCAAMDGVARAAAERAQQRHALRHEDYDRETGYGLAQGAVRPHDPEPHRPAGSTRDLTGSGLVVACVLVLFLWSRRRRARAA